MALIYESHEIKRLWPELNRAQKRKEDTYGLYAYTDQFGYKRLGIDKIKASFPSIYTFGVYLQGIEILRQIVNEFNLRPELCSLSKKSTKSILPDKKEENLSLIEDPAHSIILSEVDEYNQKVNAAIQYLQRDRSFAILDKGLKEGERSCILILRGEWVGMGYIPFSVEGGAILDQIKKLKPLKLNSFIRQTLYSFAVHNPDFISVIPEDILEKHEKRKFNKASESISSKTESEFNPSNFDYASPQLLF
jgi:DNA polymerase-3 subunit epsilon